MGIVVTDDLGYGILHTLNKWYNAMLKSLYTDRIKIQNYLDGSEK